MFMPCRIAMRFGLGDSVSMPASAVWSDPGPAATALGFLKPYSTGTVQLYSHDCLKVFKSLKQKHQKGQAR